MNLNSKQSKIDTDARPLKCETIRGLGYAKGIELQHEAVRLLRNDPQATERLFLVEHKPVITLGRSGDGSALLAQPKELAKLGIEYHHTRRGGDITYHGPGQWTIYPILRLETFCKDLHRYMRMLEEAVIVFLTHHRLHGVRVAGKTGVWLENTNNTHSKIAAIGISVSGWISFHGLALNINPDLSAFRELIVPCNIPPDEGGVTSLSQLTGKKYNMEETAKDFVECLCEVFPYKVMG